MARQGRHASSDPENRLIAARELETIIRPLAPGQLSAPDTRSWDLIKTFSGSLGVGPLVAFAVRSRATPEMRKWCDEVLIRSWRAHNRNLSHLQTLTAILDDAKIPAIVLKGPLLAGRYYGPAFLRKPSIDIDLAIKEENIANACAALSKAGYVKGTEATKLFGYDVSLYHESLPRVELHFRLSHGLTGIPVDGFFDRAVSTTLPNGRTALVLEGADELLHLVLHYAHHRFPLLANLHEIRLIWNQSSPSVREETVRKAVHYRFRGAFVMTDVAFQAVWGEHFLPTLPNLPKTWLHWRLNPDLYRECLAWSAPGQKLTLARRLRGRWLDFQVTDGPRDALRFLQMFGNVAWYRLRKGGWRTLHYRRSLSD